jgi:hypothetical protein
VKRVLWVLILAVAEPGNKIGSRLSAMENDNVRLLPELFTLQDKKGFGRPKNYFLSEKVRRRKSARI